MCGRSIELVMSEQDYGMNDFAPKFVGFPVINDLNLVVLNACIPNI